jgi:hypothetical protein
LFAVVLLPLLSSAFGGLMKFRNRLLSLRLGMFSNHRILSIAAHSCLIIIRFPHRRLTSFFDLLQLLRVHC